MNVRANENFLSLARKLEADIVKEMAVFQVLINTKLYLSRKKEKRKKAYLYQPQVSKEIRREMREGITYS